MPALVSWTVIMIAEIEQYSQRQNPFLKCSGVEMANMFFVYVHVCVWVYAYT